MKAGFVGPAFVVNVGDIVEGPDAVRFVNAGFAEPVIETAEAETAVLKPTLERAVKARKTKA